MQGIRAKVNAAAPLWFNGEYPAHAVVEGDFQPVLRKPFGGSNPNHAVFLIHRLDRTAKSSFSLS
jgi:hypothetical protein